ncbi:minor capsid protein [Salsuginibacillus halophilus]|uniref:Minor capsid protein n=1 Tax=Salsuginibacillus halophilus TaxID=517424 RepID=A0A2P8H642_9BACI|nr:hypothetical protein [Salsuginibacillus halophilus]PSL41705.1 minor capsid protein [Salsuginibacillus halophilus]
MDFLLQAKRYIEENADLFVDLLSVGQQGDGDDIAIRPTPGNIEGRYADRGKVMRFQFQILVNHKLNRTSYETILDIANTLDGLRNGAITSSDGSFYMVKCELYNTPQFVERTSDGDLHTALFEAELLIEED